MGKENEMHCVFCGTNYALNTMPNGTCRTIKNQYYKNSIANFESQGSFGATGVIINVRKKHSKTSRKSN